MNAGTRHNALLIASGTLLLAAGTTFAADENFQSFLFDVCDAPSGLLAERCGETFAGEGDVSPASESSLNPSQFLSGNSASVASVYGRGEDTRGAADPGDAPFAPEGARMDLGPFGLSLNGRILDERLAAGEAGGARPYDLTVKSAQLGIDYAADRRAVLGVWIDVDDSLLEFDGAAGGAGDAGRVETRGVGVSVVGSFTSAGGHHVDLGVGYTDNDYRLERRAFFEPVNPLVPDPVPTLIDVDAESTGDDRWLTANWSRPIDIAAWNVEPFAGLTWNRAKLAGYAERERSASGLAMRTDDLETTSLAGAFGLAARRAVSTEFAVLVPQFRAAWTWEFETDPAAASSRFLLDASESVLVVRDREPDRDALELGAGVVAVFPRGWSLFLDARTTLGLADRDRYVVSLGWRAEL